MPLCGGSRCGIGLGDDDEEVAELAVRDERLGAVQRRSDRRRGRRAVCDAGEVGAGAGLGHADAEQHLAGDRGRQVAPLLLLAAER